jgi:CRP-like cAMP-binding protein
MTETHVPAGRVLTSCGQPGTEFFVVIEGTATVWREDTKLETIADGGFFGEQSLLAHGTRTATVVAETDMKLFVLSQREFMSPYFLIPPVMQQMLEVSSERLRRADDRWCGVLASLRASSESLLKAWAPVPSLP